MRFPSVPCLLLAFAFASLAAPAAAGAQSSTPRSWDEKRIGLPVVGGGYAYVPHAPASHVVILVSGDGGWTPQLADLARHLASRQAVVIGIPIKPLARRAVREGGCWYVASDFELISHAAQRALNLPQYHPPALLGYQTGASAVYAALANTPAVTFAGAVSVSFCPTLDVAVAVCSGDVWSPEYDDRRHVNTLPTTTALPKPWHVVQGSADRVCPIARVRPLVTGTHNAHLDEVAGGSHAISEIAAWEPAIDAALQDVWTEPPPKPTAAQPRTTTMRELEDELQKLQLPLEFRWPAQMSSLLLFFSGDGGWASLDEDTSEQLVTKGVGVVGVSSLRYFWNSKTPAEVAADIRRLVGVLARSGRPIFAGGFSFGAEIVPVSLKEWTPAERRRLSGLVLVAPSPSASFEIDPLDWIRKPPIDPATLVAPAVREDAVPTLCLAGADEDDTPCPSLVGAPGVRVVRLPGSHHFDNNYTAVGDAIAQFIRSITSSAPERRP